MLKLQRGHSLRAFFISNLYQQSLSALFTSAFTIAFTIFIAVVCTYNGTSIAANAEDTAQARSIGISNVLFEQSSE